MKKMQKIATAMFIIALGGALIAWPYRDYMAGGLLFAACEAALVGALADWFAVVALFRHPLGLKFIPHTAIIPNNRDRIIDGIISIVEKDWLSLEFIKAKIFSYPLIDGLCSALESEEGYREMQRLARTIVNNTLQEISPEDAARFVQLLLKNNMKEIRVSPQLVEQLEATIKELYADEIIRLMLEWAISATKGPEFERVIKKSLTRSVADYSNQGNFFRRLGKGLGESLDILNYEEAAEVFSHRINHFLVDMKMPDNQYHMKVKIELQKLKIADSDTAAAMLSEMLKKITDSETGFKAITELIAVFKKQLLSANDQDMPIIRYLVNMVIEQVNVIRRDQERTANLELWIKTELANLLERYHGVIGQIVREKLESLNDKSLVISMEDKVGDDLQWIRINGTVIGAMVGILQYIILHLI